MSAHDTILVAEGLKKRYGAKTAVDGIDLTVRRGETYGFLGPNGAGKTTVMRMIVGITRPTSGQVLLFGRPVCGNEPSLRRQVGVASEAPYVIPDMTGEQYLQFFAELYGVADPRAAALEALERFGLLEAGRRPLRTYSQGMKQRVNLARALVHRPEILLLDEPIADLDPKWIKRLRDILLEERAAGTTVFVSSHLLSIVESICNRVAIICAGKLLIEDSVDTVKRRLGGEGQASLAVEVAGSEEAAAAAVARLAGVISVEPDGAGRIRVQAQAAAGLRQEISEAITAAGCTVLAVNYQEATLEDVYLELTEGRVRSLGGGAS